MELDQCIKGRRSVRAYTDQPVAKEQLDAILDAGVWAPTGMGRQPWRFIIIENKELIKLVSDETKELVKKNMSPLAEQFSQTKTSSATTLPCSFWSAPKKTHSGNKSTFLTAY